MTVKPKRKRQGDGKLEKRDGWNRLE
ncbi:uncharacterized protein G2W53_008929 [Senna tora]|uniref:Uncharacterized protein n=1 Tax=Senna tora TaxID=362788 RepID=A0A834WXE4_9FABA|nr:uncharacterized protein G2W53_008929 [Senna tora]